MKRIYNTPELAPPKTLIFAASGVTDGNPLRGVRFTGDGSHPQSIVINSTAARVRFIETMHLDNRLDVKVRFR